MNTGVWAKGEASVVSHYSSSLATVAIQIYRIIVTT
jgi:hypothetical protein